MAAINIPTVSDIPALSELPSHSMFSNYNEVPAHSDICRLVSAVAASQAAEKHDRAADAAGSASVLRRTSSYSFCTTLLTSTDQFMAVSYHNILLIVKHVWNASHCKPFCPMLPASAHQGRAVRYHNVFLVVQHSLPGPVEGAVAHYTTIQDRKLVVHVVLVHIQRHRHTSRSQAGNVAALRIGLCAWCMCVLQGGVGAHR